MNEIKYILMDPSKNITILVETKVPIDKHKLLAKKLLMAEPTAEQVGFIMAFDKNKIYLHMAGGEFCGNAAMSVSVYYAIENNLCEDEANVSFYDNEQHIKNIVKVKSTKQNDKTYDALVYMPKPKKIENIDLPNFKKLPMISLDGISHIIINEEIEKNTAEKNIKKWCNFLGLEALGLMFYKQIDDTNYELNPLVYVRDIDSIFWENACASGTFSFGVYKMIENNNLSQIYIKQTGGDVLEVRKNNNAEICLFSKIKLIYKKSYSI